MRRHSEEKAEAENRGQPGCCFPDCQASSTNVRELEGALKRFWHLPASMGVKSILKLPRKFQGSSGCAQQADNLRVDQKTVAGITRSRCPTCIQETDTNSSEAAPSCNVAGQGTYSSQSAGNQEDSVAGTIRHPAYLPNDC